MTTTGRLSPPGPHLPTHLRHPPPPEIGAATTKPTATGVVSAPRAAAGHPTWTPTPRRNSTSKVDPRTCLACKVGTVAMSPLSASRRARSGCLASGAATGASRRPRSRAASSSPPWEPLPPRQQTPRRRRRRTSTAPRSRSRTPSSSSMEWRRRARSMWTAWAAKHSPNSTTASQPRRTPRRRRRRRWSRRLTASPTTPRRLPRNTLTRPTA
mmetsp:Transcript_30401/g.75530  ORF Transcript_30401/g.75530 Transcript_30401/m.75530 type:complete len:212 (+) Transcript_30401:3203-3838(+)